MIYTYRDDKTGVEIDLEADSEPTIEQVQSVFAQIRPVKMSDQQLRNALVVDGGKQQASDLSDDAYYQRVTADEQSQNTTLGSIVNAIGSAASGGMQGATGGLVNLASGGRLKQGMDENKLSGSLGELIGSSVTGAQLAKLLPLAGTGKVPSWIAKNLTGNAPLIAADAIENGSKDAAETATLGLLLGGVGEGVGRLAKPAAKYLASKLSNTPQKALDAFSDKATRSKIRAGASDVNIAEDVVSGLNKVDESTFSEYQQAVSELSKLSGVPKRELIEDLTKLKQPDNIGVNESINKWVNKEVEKVINDYGKPLDKETVRKALALAEQVKPGDMDYKREVLRNIQKSEILPAQEYKRMQNAYTDAIRGAFDKEVGAKDNMVKNLRSEMRQRLLSRAEDAGNTEYPRLMEDIANKLSVVDALKSKLGRGLDQPDKARNLMTRAYGRGNVGEQKLLSELGDILGTDISDRVKYAELAKQLGMNVGDKEPSIASTMFLRSLFGGVSGAGAGALLMGMNDGELDWGKVLGSAVLGASATSPRAASYLYRGLNKDAIKGQDVAKLGFILQDILGGNQ